jgi:PII-like signaling protein
VACYLAYLFSGHTGIYLSQRIAVPKTESPFLPPDASLRISRELSPSFVEKLLNILKTPAAVFEDVQENTVDKGEDTMPTRHKVVSKEIGQLRIYMTPKEKRETTSLRKKLFGKSLYQEIINSAKEAGILNATAHHTHYGYSGEGKIEAGGMSETPNMALNLCVELISPRKDLELFVRTHGELLQGKVLVYKHMEHWDVTPRGIKVIQSDQDELDADLPPEERHQS